MSEEPEARTMPVRRVRHRRGLAVAAASAAVVAIGSVTFVEISGPRAGALPQATPITATATPALPALPVPEPAPLDEYEDVPVVAVGTIEIPSIGLVHELYSGIWLTVIDVGPGHWPGTAEPGGYGNSVIAGHRVTNTRPLYAIDTLNAGDEIIVTTDDGRFVYEVTGDEVVDPVEGMRIVDQEPGRTITLFACHPPGSAQYRYVVYGELVSEPLRDVGTRGGRGI